MHHTIFNTPVVKSFFFFFTDEVVGRHPGGAGPLIYPTGDMEKDMNIIRNFYLTVKGKYPENASLAVIHSKS